MRALLCHEVSKRFDKTQSGVIGHTWNWLSGRCPETRTAVERVSFDVAPGEIFGVLGQNGSGKSTLIRMIATLLTPDEGIVRVFGHDVTTDHRAVRSLINRVSVDAALFKKLSAVENLLFTARLYGLDARAALARIGALLEEAGIERSLLDAPVETFSRGMQQKVSIARALLTEPRLLLLDEPTTGLDPKSKLDVQAMILALRASKGTTVLLTTHDMAEAERLCDRVAIIDRGRFVALGTPAELCRLLPPAPGRRRLEDAFLHLTNGTPDGYHEPDEAAAA